MDDPHTLAFNAFIQKNWTSKVNVAKGGKITHTLFSGGNLCVSDENEFHRLYARVLRAGNERLYVNELRTQIHKMFFDFDFKIQNNSDATKDPQTLRMSDADIQALMICVHESTQKFFPDRRADDNIFRYLVCDSPAKVLDNGLLKFGIHVHMPLMDVEMNEAMLMRESLIATLRLKGPVHLAPEGWEDVVDNAVYVSSGLRMIGSRKMSNCPSCKNRPNLKSDCPLCQCSGKYDEGRPYALRAVFRRFQVSEEETKHLLNVDNMELLVRQTSIRSTSPSITYDWARYPGCPSYADVKKDKVGSFHLKHGRSRVFGEDAASLRKWKSKEAIFDSSIKEIIERAIRTRFGISQWKDMRVSQIVRTDDGRQYWINVEGNGSNFCLNKLPPDQDHASNRIWFVLDATGLSQKCFCKCLKLEGRRGKMCKDFRSPPKELDNSDMLKLFGSMTKDDKIKKKSGSVPSFLRSDGKRQASQLLEALHNELFNEKRSRH